LRRLPARTVLKTLTILAGFCAILWIAAAAGIYLAMSQPPERFGAIMTRLPTLAMIVLPFKPLWMSARAGTLQVGDQAPDFTLPLLHGDRPVTLSAEYKHTPVVLIFGSYT
jgi:hypothetical protein